MEGDSADHKPIEKPETLTEAEQATVQKTWVKVYENKEAAGVAMLIRLFTTFPSAKLYFKDFRHMEDPKEMQTSVQLKKHSVRVMSALNTLVENIYNAEKTVSVLTTVAKSHAINHNVEPRYFKMLTEVILEVLVEAFPETFVVEAQGAWAKLMDQVCWQVTQVYAGIGWSSENTAAE
ncbi:cytoglobin-1 [Trichomycterus rosablanca]|uniref:cytoglobin-1 n=1 Tax=Trichomycterus rosablanca TaxID=2290929 RepID=UPI002F3551C5